MATNVSMSYSLMMLLLVMSCLSSCDAEVRITIQQLEEMDRHLQRLNKPPVESIKSPDGDIIDCVHISHQPAFDHPLLKNHTIQIRPSFYPFGEVATEKKTDSIEQPWRRYGRCPEDTIPIRRIKRDDLLRAGSIERLGKKDHRNVSNLIGTYANSRIQDALVGVSGGRYYGAKVDINAWNPSVEDEEFSRSQVWIYGGAGPVANTVEAGWQIYPGVYGDKNTRLFIYWTRDNSRSTGCFDLFCPGFVQTNKQIALGAKVDPVSVYEGAQYEITIKIWQDPATKNWWFQFQSYDPLGYWPASLFTNFADGASMVHWGGWIGRKSPDLSPPHTTTMMGSGAFPEEGPGRASYMRKIQLLDQSQKPQDPTNLFTSADDPHCYNVSLGNGGGGADMGVYIYYGGPGANPFCP